MVPRRRAARRRMAAPRGAAGRRGTAVVVRRRSRNIKYGARGGGRPRRRWLSRARARAESQAIAPLSVGAGR
eukprot:SAG31_NODE_584_length_13886_cov_96.615000_6_plen_72_part_00